MITAPNGFVTKLKGSGGKWYKLEQEWKSALEKRKSVQVKIKPRYTGTSKRPDSFDIEYSINGSDKVMRQLKNTPTGE